MSSRIVGKDCWTCRYRNSDDWFVLEGFCHFYPSLREREILKGNVCPYYEAKRSTGDLHTHRTQP